MKSQGIIFLSSFILSVLLVISSTSSTGATAAAPHATATGRVSPEKNTWQQEWDQCVAKAKKEGRVVVAASMGPQVRGSLSKAFAGKYGVAVEFVQGRPAELIPKIMAERRAGIFSLDLYIAGAGSLQHTLGAADVLELIDDELMLSEVLDKKAWWGGDFLWADPEKHYHLFFLAGPRYPITINTDLVKSDDIKSYRDLLHPKWKGKIAWSDPTVDGGGDGAFIALANLMDIQYLRELGKQGLFFTRDLRLLVEWVARGKYPIVIGLGIDQVTKFIQDGAPINVNPVAEGAYINSTGIALLKNAPNPNAAKLFLNWFLSRDGQIVASKAWGRQSAREDIPTDILGKFGVRKPGVKYLQVDNIKLTRGKEYEKIVQDMWGHLLK